MAASDLFCYFCICLCPKNTLLTIHLEYEGKKHPICIESSKNVKAIRLRAKEFFDVDPAKVQMRWKDKLLDDFDESRKIYRLDIADNDRVLLE